MIPLGFFSKEKWELLSLLERSLLPSLVQTPVPVYFNITSAICIAISVCKQSIFSASTWTKQNCALTHQIPVFMSNHKCLNHIAQGKLTESFLHSLAEWERIRSASSMRVRYMPVNTPKAFLINHLWTTWTGDFSVFFLLVPSSDSITSTHCEVLDSVLKAPQNKKSHEMLLAKLKMRLAVAPHGWSHQLWLHTLMNQVSKYLVFLFKEYTPKKFFFFFLHADRRSCFKSPLDHNAFWVSVTAT